MPTTRRAILCFLSVVITTVMTLALVTGCEQRSSRRTRPRYAKAADVTALNEVVKQTQERLVSAEQRQAAEEQQDASYYQRVAVLEQNVSVLQQTTTNLAQENQVLRQQLTQTQMELAATQEEVKQMKLQAGRAQRVVRDWKRNGY